MSLNGLVNACNQKNNRLPRTDLDEDEVKKVIEELRIKRLVHRVDLVGSRVPKYQHNAEKELDLIKPERALLAELLNRGPQTAGELNNRVSRMFTFDGIPDIEDSLQELKDREPSLVGNMDPAPGQKGKRWFNLLAPPPVVEEMNDGSSLYVPGPDKRIDQVEEMTKEFTELKDEVEALRYQLRELSDEFKNFRKQFD
jgi:hypothetical protein